MSSDRKDKRLLWVIAAAAVGLFASSTYLAVEARRHAIAQNEQRRIAEVLAVEAKKEQAATEAARAEAEDRMQRTQGLLEQAREEMRLVRGRLYDLHMRLAQSAWDDGNVQGTLENLELERPQTGQTDVRGFEWYYWNSQCHRDLMTLRGHTSEVECMALSRDGATIASASDGMVKLWNAITGELKHTLTVEHSEESAVVIQGIALSPDGMRAAFTGPNRTVKICDVGTGQEASALAGFEMEVTALAFSPDAKWIVTANPGEQQTEGQIVRFWDTSTWRESRTFKSPKNWVCTMAFSPDSKRIAVASLDDTFELWDGTTGDVLLTFAGHRDVVDAVAFSPDGSRIASGSWDQTVKLWDAATGAEMKTLKGHAMGIWDVAFSPDGKLIASAAGSRGVRHQMDNTIRLWDTTQPDKNAEFSVLRGHTATVQAVAFSPDGHRIVSAGDTVKVWETPKVPDSPIRAADVPGATLQLAVSPDGARVATSHEFGSVRLWDAAAGRQVLRIAATRFSLSADGERIAVPNKSANTVTVWATADGKELLKLQGHSAQVRDVVFSQDGKLIASAGDDQTAKLWDAATGHERRTLAGHFGRINMVAFSPDGTLLATASDDRTVKLWDAASGFEKLTLAGLSDQVADVSFSPDGSRLVSRGKDEWDNLTGDVNYWNVATGVVVPVAGLDGRFSMRFVFSPDGKWFVPLGRAVGSLQVYDVATGECKISMKPLGEGVFAVAWSADGSRLACAYGPPLGGINQPEKGMAQIWDANSWVEIHRLAGHDNAVTQLVFSPDGTRLASVSSVWDEWTPNDERVKLWDVATGEETAALKGQWDRSLRIAFNKAGESLISGGSLGTVKVWEAPRRSHAPRELSRETSHVEILTISG